MAGCLKDLNTGGPSVICTAEIDETAGNLSDIKIFELSDLFGYQMDNNVTDVPLVSVQSKVEAFNGVNIYKLTNGLKYHQIRGACYMGADGVENEVDRHPSDNIDKDRARPACAALPAQAQQLGMVQPGFSINWELLGGFMAVLGAGAVALAFTVLAAATLAVPGVVVASVGAAVGLAGLGLFAYGIMRGGPDVTPVANATANCC